jgi:hypothetical protein
MFTNVIARNVTRLIRFIAFMNAYSGVFVHEYSGRFISPSPVFTSVTDTQNDPQSATQEAHYVSTFSIDGQWYLLWSGSGSPNPGTVCRLLTTQRAGSAEESAITFISVTGITSLASKRSE